ncbi:hypothetical protein GLOTRDRAFT_113088 [Gloeophyllum trabeum ATCC 11539]|uniref:Uncharacterized protein n=1 Tax=Gloeophyllum trabeum (strain ATCC 11539 / FP-39264 / Madison 617) TaxID=670483 RepID=S7QKV7_GLOTA|nr:uncharacterized protein GLOTRDRAFT_113088 [Gloeophyllum trabeum ATCC 11539]EPQ60461.1 hypothetical protein GLOTRDRAFT_113088 [Gloeophyllum trabeum ATCC 11539]
MRPPSLSLQLRTRADAANALTARFYSDLAAPEPSQNGPLRRVGSRAPIANMFGDISIQNVSQTPTKRIVPAPAPAGQWKPNPRYSIQKQSGTSTLASRLAHRRVSEGANNPTTSEARYPASQASLGRPTGPLAGEPSPSLGRLQLQRRSDQLRKEAPIASGWNNSRSREGKEGGRSDRAPAQGRRNDASTKTRTTSIRDDADTKEQSPSSSRLTMQRRSELSPSASVTQSVTKPDDDEKPVVPTTERKLLPSPSLVKLDSNALDSLFSQPAIEETATIPFRASSNSKADQSPRLQSLLEQNAGDYSRYLPAHFHSQLIDSQQLGSVGYAEFALARQRSARLASKRTALDVVKRYSGNVKDARSSL